MSLDQAIAADCFQTLQTMMASDRKGGVGEISLVEVNRGQVAFEGTPDRSVYNPMGSVHGGYAATLLDDACGIATQSALGPGKGASHA